MKKIKLTDLQPDTRNANRGTERGRGMLERSLSDLGAGRSILVDRHNVAIAGNKTLETAIETGFEDAIVVETDGTQLVVVKRTDLDLSKDEKAKKLAIADNRAGEINLEWDPEVLDALSQEIDLSGLFSEQELEKLLGENNFSNAADQSADISEKFQILINCESESQQGKLLDRLTSEGFECRSLIS